MNPLTATFITNTILFVLSLFYTARRLDKHPEQPTATLAVLVFLSGLTAGITGIAIFIRGLLS